MEKIPQSESSLENIFTEIERVIGLNIDVVKLEETDTRMRIQLSKKSAAGQPLSYEEHQQYKDMFIDECDGILESNIDIKRIDDPTHQGYASSQIVNLVIDLDKTKESE